MSKPTDTKTITQTFDALSPEDKKELRDNIADAVYHLACCWDSLREAECVLETEIETDDISPMAGETTVPADAYNFIDLDYVREFLEGMEEKA